MINFDIDKDKKTPYLILLESLVDQSNALKTIHNHKTWCLSALTYALHLNDCLVLFEDLRDRWSRELPFGEAWDVDFDDWVTKIWSAANNIQSEVKQWKSLCDNDYRRFIELSQQVADGVITITPLVEFVENKETSIQNIITDAARKLSDLFYKIEHDRQHYVGSLYLSFYDECIETYTEINKKNLHMVYLKTYSQPYDAWEASKTEAKRPAAIKKLMEGIVKQMDAYKSLEEVWNDCYDPQSNEIEGESIARNLFINRRVIIGNTSIDYRDTLDKLFYTVTMLEFLKERLKKLTSSDVHAISVDEQEQKRQPSNNVFRETINGKYINFGKLIDFIREYAVDTITFKNEWMAIYLFAFKHNLLKVSQLNVFAEQMNKTEWFGYLVARRQCSADAMGDYNYLSTIDRNHWEDDSRIPTGCRATTIGLNRIIKKYNNLEINFSIEKIINS